MKGRIIHPPRNFRGRPTTDMAKEALFNILANRIEFSEISILDLFSGSGNISFEFASRGCRNITCVEKDFYHYRFIKQTIASFGFPITAIHGDAIHFLEKVPGKYDLIFADPPFNLPDLNKLPDLIIDGQVLNEKGILILEHPKEHNFTKIPQFSEVRQYGHVNFSFFKQSPD